MPDRESFVPQAKGETSGDGGAAHHPAVSLLGLFLVCLQIGLFSFGGGLSGWIYQEVVVRRRWMSEDEFLSGLALSRPASRPCSSSSGRASIRSCCISSGLEPGHLQRLIDDRLDVRGQ